MLRLGRYVGSYDVGATTDDEMVAAITGAGVGVRAGNGSQGNSA